MASASHTCFNLDDPEYFKEIDRLGSAGIKPDSAVSVIPRKTFDMFFERDYLRVFCPDMNSYKDIMDIYSKKICDCIAPELIGVSKNERYRVLQKITTACNGKMMPDTTVINIFQSKALESNATLAQLSRSGGRYVYFACPLLKDELRDIPGLVHNNNLERYWVKQKWQAVESLSKVIKGELPSDNTSNLFYDNKTLTKFNDQVNSLSVTLKTLKGSKPSTVADWEAQSCKQTFGLAESEEHVEILFQFLYHFHVDGVSLKISKSELINDKSLQKDSALIGKFKAKFNEPGLVDPLDKPLPPLPPPVRK